MAEIAKLEALVEKLAEANVQLNNELRNASVAQKAEVDRVIAALGQGGGNLQPQQPNVGAVRAKNVANLKLAFRKSSKVKDFRESQDLKVQDWLKRFDEEAIQLKNMNCIENDLEPAEYIACFKDKLKYNAIKRLDTAFANYNPVITWANVTKQQLHENMIAEFGKRESDVSAILLQFGPNRFKKAPDMSVATFYHLWQDQLPPCMQPDNANANENFMDLVKRALFYFCLDDKYLQEQLCQLKDEDLTLKKFFDEARLAEQRRKSFLEIGVSGSQLDSSSGISVNRWEARSGNSNGGKSSGHKKQWSGNSDNGGKGSVERQS